MKEKEKMSLVDLGKRLLEASRNGQADEVSMLMASGAPFTTDWLGTSPLHLAAQHGHTQTAEVLLRAGVSRDARTKVDRTPLHMAAQNGHTGIVELLISGGACVNNKDMLNMTPLHWACERGHVEIIKILLRSGANLDVASKFNKTPQDIARQKGHNEAVALLVSDQDQSKIPVNIKRQADRSNLGLNALKKRQRTKKFPMTAGTWTGTDGPGGKGECGVKNRKKATTPGSLPKSAVANGRRVSAPPQYPNAGSPSLRSPTANSIASLVSAADFVKRESYSEGPESKKPAVSKATSEQDSSILNTLATLATANISQSSVVSTSTAPQQATSIAARSSGVTPLSLPSNTSAALSSLTTPLTPSGNFWAPIPSPLTALSVLSSLTSPAQLSPLPNFAMSPFTVPVTISPQGVPTGQHYLPFVNSGAALTQTTPTSVSTAIAAASTATEAVAVPIGGVAMTSSDNAAHATMSQAFTIPSLSVTGMSNQCQATSQYALLAPHQVSTSPTLMLDAAQFGILNGAAAGGSRVEQGKPAAVQETSQDSTETKPDESLPQTAQASSGQELLVTLQVPAGLQHVFPSQIVTGDQPITLQQIQLVPQVVNQEPAGYLTPQVVGPVSQVQSGASVVQASQPQFSVQTAVVPQSASSQDSGTQTQCPPVNPPRTSPPPTSTKTPNQDQLATTQASQNNLLSTQGQSSILLQSQSPSPVLVQGQGQVVLQGQGQVITGQLAQQPLQQVVVGSQLQQSATSAQQTVTQSQSFSQGQAASQRVTSVPQQNQQQISQQLLQQSIPGAGTSLPGTTSTAASIQSLLQQSFVPQLSQVVIQGGADSSQVTQGSQTQLAPHHVLLQVQEEYRKILEQKQAEEERTRKDLQEKLFALQRDSEKYRDELEQAQREAENYKGKLEAESRERVRLHQLYEASKQSPSEELTTVTSVKQEAEKMA